MADPAEARQPLFLARQTYRRRRLMDAARLLPVFGAALIFLPTLWARTLMTGGTAQGIVFIFVIWALLIVLAAILARKLSEPIRKDLGTVSQRHDDGF